MIIVENVVEVDYGGFDIVFFLVGGGMFWELVFYVVVLGVMVIDNLLVWCFDLDVLLVVVEVNLYVFVFVLKGIIVNLNCMIMVVMFVLKFLYVVVGLKCFVVSIY